MTVWLFDWGDTLMHDLPGMTGKMCQWPQISVVDGAVEVLALLSVDNPIYLASNAADSSTADIAKALRRGGLATYIKGIFCRHNLGCSKADVHFYQQIVAQLGVAAPQITMVGDNWQQDVQCPMQAGLQAIWFNPRQQPIPANTAVRQIHQIHELLLNTIS